MVLLGLVAIGLGLILSIFARVEPIYYLSILVLYLGGALGWRLPVLAALNIGFTGVGPPP